MDSGSPRIYSYSTPFIVSLLALITISVGAEILDFAGAQDIFIYSIYFPILEEGFKFIARIRMPSFVFRIIIAYAILEVAIAKAPIFLWDDLDELLYQISFSITAFNFHLATAYVYSRRAFINARYAILIFMIAIHSIFNMLDFFNFSAIGLLSFSGLASFTPYIALFFVFMVLKNQR